MPRVRRYFSPPVESLAIPDTQFPAPMSENIETMEFVVHDREQEAMLDNILRYLQREVPNTAGLTTQQMQETAQRRLDATARTRSGMRMPSPHARDIEQLEAYRLMLEASMQMPVRAVAEREFRVMYMGTPYRNDDFLDGIRWTAAEMRDIEALDAERGVSRHQQPMLSMDMASLEKRIEATFQEKDMAKTTTRLLRAWREGGKRAAHHAILRQMREIPFYLDHPDKYDTDWEPKGHYRAMGHRIRTAVRNQQYEEAAGLTIVMIIEYSTYPKGMLLEFLDKKILEKAVKIGKDAPMSVQQRIDELVQQYHNHRCIAWNAQNWWAHNAHERAHHFLKPADSNPQHVSYFENPTRLYQGRRSTLRPGRYLAKFFDNVLDAASIKVWATKQTALIESWEGKLLFAESTDKKGWQYVYENGPHSCMSGENAVQVYAHDKSVLRLAYWRQEGAIQARAIVRDDDKTWIRIYPAADESRHGSTLKEQLAAAGYKRQGSLIGVLLEAKEKNNADQYVCPYLDDGDGDTPYVTLVTRGGKQYLSVEESGEVHAQETQGFVDFDKASRCNCDVCGSEIDEDDRYTAEDDDYTYCSDCFSGRYVEAYCSSSALNRMRWILRDDAVIFGDNYYVNNVDVLNAHDIGYCDSCGAIEDMCDLHSTPCGDDCCDNCVDSLDEPFEDCTYAYPCDIKELADGRMVHMDWVDPNAPEEELAEALETKKKRDELIRLPLAYDDCIEGMKLRALRDPSPLYSLTSKDADDLVTVKLVDSLGRANGATYSHIRANLFIPDEIWQAHIENKTGTLCTLPELLAAVKDAIDKRQKLPYELIYPMQKPNTTRRAA